MDGQATISWFTPNFMQKLNYDNALDLNTIIINFTSAFVT